jgi:hypothetical protein
VAAQRGSERLRLRKKLPFSTVEDSSYHGFGTHFRLPVSCWYMSRRLRYGHSGRAQILTIVAVRLGPRSVGLTSRPRLLYLFPNPTQCITCNHANTSFGNDEATDFYQIMVSRNGFHTKESRHRGLGLAFRSRIDQMWTCIPAVHVSSPNRATTAELPLFHRLRDARNERVEAVGLWYCSSFHHSAESVYQTRPNIDCKQ